MKLTVVILAAGQGKRMNSDIPKVMHQVAGIPMLEVLLDTVSQLETQEIRVVSSNELMEYQPFQDLKDKYKFDTYIQKERHGTADALKIALKTKPKSPVLVMCGDAPLIKAETINKMVQRYEDLSAKVLCLGFRAKNPHGYGRLISYENDLLEIIEEKDATPEQRNIDICNSGVYIIDNSIVEEVLSKITNTNASNEFYLTDAVKVANKLGYQCVYHVASEKEVMGVNDRYQLSQAEKYIQKRLRRQHLKAGVTMVDPNTVFLSLDTKIGRDVVIHPNVVIGAGVEIKDHAEIYPFTHIAGAMIGENCKVGPFARIRQKTELGKNSRIGNFVETKAIKIGKGSKASHLSYLGDGQIGDNTNIGAGTIFCNYDGYSKQTTMIGSDVFVGSNTALIAPVKVGDGAIVGAGSVITEDVEKDALSIARARQVNFNQKAELIRSKRRK